MKRDYKSEADSALRQKAEILLNNRTVKRGSQLSEIDALKLVQELEVYQIELELQNEELFLAKARAEELSTEKYAELYDFAPSGYFTLSKEGNIIELNLCGSQMLGKERALLKNYPFNSFISHNTRSIFYLFLEKVFKSKSKETCEVTLSANVARLMYVHLDGIVTDNGTQCMVTMVDISELKRVEERLQESERFLKETQEIAKLGTYVTDITSGKWSSSEVMDAILGIDTDFEKTVEGWFSIIHPEWQKIMKDYFVQEVIGNKAKFDKEYKIIRQNDKAERWVHGIGHLKLNIDNQPVSMVGTILDITERKQSQEALNYEQYLLHTIMNNIPAHIYFKDSESRFIRINNAHAHLFGLSDPDQAIGKTDFDFFTKDHAQSAYNDEQEIIRTGQPVSKEEKETWSDHPDTWVSTNKLPLRNADGKIIGAFGISAPITERKRAEEELRRSQKKYSNLYTMFRLLADNTEDFLWAKDMDEKYIFVNKTLCDRLLIADDINEPIGKSDMFFAKRQRESHPEDPQWHTFGENCSDSDKLILKEEIPKQFDEFGNVRGKFLFLDVHKSPIKDEQGNLIGVVGTARDVTAIKKLENEKSIALEALKKSEEDLRKINAEKDKFFSIIAHDLRSPFNGFLGLTEIMTEGLQRMTLAEIKTYAMTVRSSATNLFRLLGNLLEWSRMERGLTEFAPATYLLMPKISESLVLVLDAAGKKEITVGYNVPEEMVVIADGNMFEGIIRNLVTNAVKFSHKSGSVMISAKSVSDKFIEISVNDKGIGMSAERINDLFRLDVNTNRKGTEGEYSTGLGLLICKDFIEKHGGQLWIESEEEKGSTFRFTIPGRMKE